MSIISRLRTALRVGLVPLIMSTVVTATALRSLPAQTVSPSYGSLTAPTNSSGNYADFEVDNTDYYAQNWSVYCYTSAPVTSCSSPSSVYVDAYSSAYIDVTFSTSYAGDGGLTLSVGGMIGGSGEGYYDITVQDTRIAPTIAVASGGDVRDITRCVANCFEKAMSFAPPTYVSMNSKRAVTLVYRSGSAHPMGNVQLDVTDNSATQADIYKLQLQRQDGSYVTFTNGTQALFFQSSGHYVATHLAAAFDATSVATGRYTYTPIVTSIWNSDGNQLPTYGTLHLIIQNESGSPFGAGWTIAGVQHVYAQSDGALVTDGAGSATFFSGNCAPNTNCTYASPSGEFSTFKTTGSGYSRVYPDGSNLAFGSDGKDLMNSDRFGNYYFYNYGGPNGALNYIQDPAIVTTILGFEDGTTGGKVGTLHSIQTPGGRNALLLIDSNNDLRRFQNVDQISDSADYVGHQLSHYRDRRGGDWNFGYSLDGTVASQLAPTVTINGTGQRPSSSQVGGSTNIINATTGTVGSQANPIPCSMDTRARTTNARGNATYYTLNLWGQSTLTRDALGRNTTAVYDANTGLLLSATRPNGHNVQYTYDGPRLTLVHDYGTGQIINTAYEATYSRPTHIWGNTVEQWFYYTGTRMDSTRSGASNAAVNKYWTDSKGRVWKHTDQGGHSDSTWYATSGFENTDSVVTAGHRVTKFRYDAYGRTRAVVPPIGQGDSTVYDLLNRVTGTVDIATQHKTSSQYDALYLTSVTDARNNTSSYTRNALGWPEQELRAGSTTPLVKTFDANGNVATFQNRRQQTVTFTYDALDRMTRKSMASGDIVFGYGASDNFASTSDAASVDTVFYNAAGRPANVKTWRGGTWSWYNLQYTYNTDGTLARLDATSNMWSGTRGPQFYYYPSGELQYFDDFGKRITFGVDAENLGTSIGFPSITNNTNHDSQHGTFESSFTAGTDADYRLGVTGNLDDLGRMSERLRHADEDSLRDFSYNSDGSLATRRLWSSVAPSCTFTIDGVSCTEGSYTLNSSETYSYDEVGNLMNGVTAVDYPGNRIRAANGYSYSYDPDGNLISKTGPGFTQTLQWNEVGQLTSATTNGSTTNFTYDGFGRRVSGERYYLYNGANQFMELTSGGNVTAEYAFLPGMDQPLMVSRGTELLYFAMDPTSSSVHGLIRDGDNVVRAQYGYTPYGQLEAGAFDNTQNGGNPLRFAAREFDSSTGLYFFRARYYDPQLGRFISEDPTGFAGGVNLYAYAGDDPINSGDPTGEKIRWHLFGIRWRSPWHDIGHYGGPIAAFVAISAAEIITGGSATAAFAAAGKTLAATAVGSAIGGTAEGLASGKPIFTAFMRDFNLSSWFLFAATASSPLAGGFAGAGEHYGVQGFVRTNSPLFGSRFLGGALTLGAATSFEGIDPEALIPETAMLYSEHEMGHTVQFWIMSGLSWHGNPWYVYSGLGLLGLAGQYNLDPTHLGCVWENAASYLGGGDYTGCP